MVISDFAIKRPMITVVTMVALVVFGLFALWRLEVDEFPDIQQPVVLTFIPYPGASPEGVEREILRPVEDAIKGISGVDKMFGTAGDGYAQIITLFLFEKDPQVATQDIRDAISGIRADLPVEMEEPVLPAVRSGRSADRLDDDRIADDVSGAAHAAGRSRHHQRAPRNSRHRPGSAGRRCGARDDDPAQAAGAAGGRASASVRWCRRCSRRISPRRWDA